MRLDFPILRERFGAVLLYGLQSVYELDAGLIGDDTDQSYDAIRRIPYETRHEALCNMAIVIPTHSEKIKLIEGVIAGIPYPCKIILVSNSPRTPIDRFQLEKDLIKTISGYNHRRIVCVHQKDPIIARAFQQAGYTDILGEDGLVRDGKSEGMMVATVLTRIMNKRTIGFIDSDNYIPGAILEYCHLFASGFLMARDKEDALVRISWSSKPKIIENNLFFAKWGRASIITNRYINHLISHYTGFETEVIKTGNAGEHAMTIDLAMKLGWSTGYSIEPYQLVYLMEQFGGAVESTNSGSLSNIVNVYQLETRNPHLHESKGEEHVQRMIESSLSVIYHSQLCPDWLKSAIEQELQQRDILQEGKSIPAMRLYPPLENLNLSTFRDCLREGNYGIDEYLNLSLSTV